MRFIRLIGCLVFLAMLSTSVWQIIRIQQAVSVEQAHIGSIPLTIFRPHQTPAKHVAVLAHGFAGSQQMLYPLATTLAHHNWTVITFDFNGHGQNSDVFSTNGGQFRNTQNLEATLDAVIQYARQTTGIQSVALVGHSMGSAVVVNYATTHPNIIATVGLSLISDQTTPTTPPNLLILTGDLEFANIKSASQRALLNGTNQQAVANTTYGDPIQGTGRRLEWVPSVEHISILYTSAMHSSVTRWLQASVGASDQIIYTDRRMLWIGLSYGAGLGLLILLLGWLPRVADARQASGGWRMWLVQLLPAIATPLVLAIMPVNWVPILVGGYVTMFFAIYGVFQFLAARGFGVIRSPVEYFRAEQIGLGVAIGVWILVLLGGIAHISYLNFLPTTARLLWIAVFIGMMFIFFMADVSVNRGAWGTVAARILFIAALFAGTLLRSDAGFVLLILPLFVIFFGVMALTALAVRGRVAVVTLAIASALVFGWMLGIALPYTG